MVGGFDVIKSYGPEDIEVDYFKTHKKILSEQRGNGLWLWKPYFILRTMNESADGDYIFYSDSGAFFIRSIDNLINSMDRDIWVSDIPLIEESFTKEACFEKMACTTDYYRKTNQIQGTFLLLKNTEHTRNFVSKWLELCENIDLLGPAGENEENKCLISHREDQSILSLLCKKEGIKAHRDPSHRGTYPEWYNNGKYPYIPAEHNDKYKTVLYLHKTQNVSLKKCLTDYFKCVRAHKSGMLIKKHQIIERKERG